MTSPLDTYLGWDQPDHFGGCKKPSWQVDVRTDHDVRREQHGAAAHECPQRYETCGHSDHFTRTTVRLVCPSCQAAFVFEGEGNSDWGSTKSTTDGYGLPPRKVAGLLLWPGKPWLPFGRLSTDEPHDFVVTRLGIKRVEQAAVVGQITQSRGKRRGVVWTAAALPSPTGKYGMGTGLRWSHVSEDGPLRTVAAAARWIGARLTEQQAGGAPS